MKGESRHFDVIIIGAGISGVSAAYHLQTMSPGKTYAILEGRDAIGGTWDLFRYPGIRSDSDMFTLGFSFNPWPDAKVIADGPSIRKYVIDTADKFGITPNIQFNTRVSALRWSSEVQRWTIEAERGAASLTFTADFVISCAGYYKYSEGYSPEFPGAKEFAGDIIHPQHWPENYDYSGKNVVVIGSGATAVTLVPALAEKAQHVTMLQRSPTYYFSLPGTSKLAQRLKKVLPSKFVHGFMRWQRVLLQQFSYKMIRKFPERSARNLTKLVKDKLPKGYDVKTHFKPRYNPWDQRLCVVPDDDLFDAITAGKASVVTDTIEKFSKTGIVLSSGNEIDADAIITATGLNVQLFGGAEIEVDGRIVEPGTILTYKGAMFEGVPNFMSVFGYTNASWTLRSDLLSHYLCRMLNYLDSHNYASVTPVNTDPEIEHRSMFDFTSGYITRVEDRLPKQGDKEPWRQHQDYFYEMRMLKRGKIGDECLVFEKRKAHEGDGETQDMRLAG